MTETQFSGIDFAVGIVRGVRSWDVTADGILTGCVYHQAWTMGENNALCRKDADLNRPPFAIPPSYSSLAPVQAQPNQDFKPPAPGHMFDCQCGFYAYYDGSNDYYRGDYATYRRVTGVIEGYGETMVGTRGFRCLKARVVALYVSERFGGDIDLLRSNYPVVPLFDTFEAMVREFPEEDGGAREKHRRDEEERQAAAAAKRAEEEAAQALAALDDDGGSHTV